MQWKSFLLGRDAAITAPGSSFGLLIVRVSAGLSMLFLHGWDKLANFSSMDGRFPDPLGIGSTPSLALVVLAEVFCAAAVVLGLATRLVCVPLIVAMAVAAFVQHGGDPWAKKELAVLYLSVFSLLFFSGGGRLSVDALLSGRG